MNKIVKVPTGFGPGPTFVYINGGPPKGTSGHWVKLRLIDHTAYNKYGIGAKVTVNQHLVRRMRATSGSIGGSAHEHLHIGLGEDVLRTLDIIWPSGSMEVQNIVLDQPVEGETLCIERLKGVVDCG